MGHASRKGDARSDARAPRAVARPGLTRHSRRGAPAAYRQLVQVARALAFDCRVLALDEPTTSLTDAEVDDLFAVLNDLRQRGVTLIYVSHRLPELFELCERIHGPSRRPARRDVRPRRHAVRPDRPCDGGARSAAGRGQQRGPARVRPAASRDRGTDAAACVRAGLAFRCARARSSVCSGWSAPGAPSSSKRCSAFTRRKPAAFASSTGQAFPPRRAAARAGMALVPEDRQNQGLFFNLDLRHNLVLSREMARGSLCVRDRLERSEAQEMLLPGT